jgi:hypothetical protein
VFPPGFKKGRVQGKKGRVQLFTKKGTFSALSTKKGQLKRVINQQKQF